MGEPRSENLVRAIGVRQMAASIVNSTIGAGIFVVPALVAQGLGPAAPIAYVICAVTMALVVTTFATAASRVRLTGGLFACVETAFGIAEGEAPGEDLIVNRRGAHFPNVPFAPARVLFADYRPELIPD